MFNKQILENKGEEFEILYRGDTHTIPSGKFEVQEAMGTFIVGFAKKCKLSVVRVGSPEKPGVKAIIEPVIAPVEETVTEKKTETKVEETKTEEVKEETTPKRTFGSKA